MVCVTTCVCGVTVRITRFVVTTRRMRLTGFFAACRLRTTLGPQGAHRTDAEAGTSAIFIAPLPISAPPQVQAQSLARAIRTDIIFLSLFPVAMRPGCAVAPPLTRKRPKLCERVHGVNRICLSGSGKSRTESTHLNLNVPKQYDMAVNSIALVNRGLIPARVARRGGVRNARCVRVSSAWLHAHTVRGCFGACVGPGCWV